MPTSGSNDSDNSIDGLLKKRYMNTWKLNQKKYARLHDEEYVHT